MSLVFKLIFICTCFYLLGMSTTEKSKNLTKEEEQFKKENETRGPNFDEHFNCIRNCTGNNPESCEEAIRKNKMKDGIYLLNILPNKLEPFYGFCQQSRKKLKDSQAWILIQKRQDGSVNFYRNWFDYKYGFGDLYREFWIGLERLYQMTNCKNYKLWIKTIEHDNNEIDMFYSIFSISSEEEGYKLTVGGYTGFLNDPLTYHNGKRFSTFDNDVSQSRYFCPNRHRSGWWHDNCTMSNLNGPYRTASNNRAKYAFIYHAGMSATPWIYCLQYVHMAIRPI